MSRITMAVIGTVAVLALVLGGIAMYLAQPDRTLARREAAWHARIQPGDIVLQELACGLRCDLVSDLTHSRYTNLGVVLEQGGRRVVWDSFLGVDFVPLGTWMERGKKARVAVYRPEGVAAKVSALEAGAQALRGTPFDPDFQWDDARLYPAEFVAKLFDRAGLPLVQPHPLGAGAFGTHGRGVAGLTEGKLTEQTPVVMPADFTHAPGVHKVIDELEGPP